MRLRPARGMVPLDQLNDNEQRVLFALETNGPSKIGDVARSAWADIGYFQGGPMDWEQAQSWVRNSLRRLVASGWVVQLGPGLYGTHESLEPRLGGLAVADAEEAHDAAERAFQARGQRIEALAGELAGMREALVEDAKVVRTTWKALVAARKAVMVGRVDGAVKTMGAQHERFEDTLPRPRARRKAVR